MPFGLMNDVVCVASSTMHKDGARAVKLVGCHRLPGEDTEGSANAEDVILPYLDVT